VPFFICPNCKNRSVDHDGYQGMTREAVACDRCGFGFLFELMDDYYPAPNAGFVVCDNQGRVIACGRGLFELSGFPEEELIGRDVVEAFQLGGFEADRNPVALALEWGVRRLDEHLELTTRGGQRKHVTVDVFPAYDDDGGLLVSLTPTMAS
jgi:PAS domain S-box-containing protein